MTLKPTGWPRPEPEIREPDFGPIPSDEYEPLNAHLTEGDWPDLSEPGEEPTWRIGAGEPDTRDPYEWKWERDG